MTTPNLHPRGDTTHCVKCRRRFNPGDRVLPAYIIASVGANPNDIRQAGSFLSGEFELVHVFCDDPIIHGSIIST